MQGVIRVQKMFWEKIELYLVLQLNGIAHVGTNDTYLSSNQSLQISYTLIKMFHVSHEGFEA